MTVSVINRQNQMTRATNCINFSTVKKSAMLENDTFLTRVAVSAAMLTCRVATTLVFVGGLA